MSKREEQRAFRRQQILLCCMNRILTHGYAGMKLRDIASELSISPGLIFNYFASKEDIYLELIRMGVQGPMHLVSESLMEQSPIALFEKMTAMVLRFMEDEFVAKMFLLMTRTLNSMDVPPTVKEVIADMDVFRPLIPVILRGQQEGSIKQGDSAALLLAYWGAIQGIAASHALEPALPLPESEWIVDILRAR